MSDLLVLCVDRSAEQPDESAPLVPREVYVTSEAVGPSCSSLAGTTINEKRMAKNEALCNEEEPLIKAAECRICQEEDAIKNLETPCACSGSLKYAHRKCVQHWCNEKGDITCEICHQPYQPGYTAPCRTLQAEEIAIDIGGGWTISRTPLDLHDSRLLTIPEAERHFFEAEYDEYTSSNSRGAASYLPAALIFVALLLFRQTVSVTDHDGDDDTSTFLSIFLLRAVGFLLPCYIMAWAISILQRRRQRQFGQHRDLQFTLSPGPPTTSNPQTV